MKQVQVTVLMPVYNGEAFLREAIDSILNQTFTDFEFIIINDGSTDRSEDIIKSYTDSRIKYYKNESNVKLIATLNKGFDLAAGKYIARMDADDFSLPSRLALQFELMESKKEIGLCGTWFDTFNGYKTVSAARYAPDHATICFRHLFQIHLSHGTCMFRASVLKEHGLYFNPDFSHAEDYELWSRISTVTKLANIQQVLYKVRQHENEVSLKHGDVQRANSYRVKTHLFKLMGIGITDKELDLLQAIAYHQYESNEQFLVRAQSLLEKMMLAKNYEVFFSKSFYEKNVADYWFNINYNSTSFLGMAAYKRYFSSRITNLRPLDPATRIKFIIKGMLGK